MIIDEVLSHPLLMPHIKSNLLIAMRDAQIVKAQNIADYFAEQEAFDKPAEHRPRYTNGMKIRPPWDVTWIEYTLPLCMEMGAVRQSPNAIRMRLGVLVHWHENPPGVRLVLFRSDAPHGCPCIISTVQTATADGAFVEYPFGSPGEVFRPRVLCPRYFGGSESIADKNAASTWMLDNLVEPAMLALVFSHCQNTKVRKDELPCGLRKARAKKSAIPVFSTYTITIGPVLAGGRAGTGKGTGIEHREYICRGHFRHYDQATSKGLFGRYFGTFWIPAHKCGNPELGTIQKDYEVEIPQENVCASTRS